MGDGVEVYGHRCWHGVKLRCIAAKARPIFRPAAVVEKFLPHRGFQARNGALAISPLGG
jgi:hypothetical protein